MRTDDLINAIAADAGTSPRRFAPALWAALAVSAVAAWFVGWSMMPPRPPVDPAFAAVRFPMKFVLTGAFGVAAAALAMRLATPGAALRPARGVLFAALALLAAAVLAELYVTPGDLWETRMVGQNWLVCLIHVPILSAIPLVVTLLAFRRGAPGSPTRLGAAAGLLAGAVGATVYAAHCPDDSPLFLGVWYTLAVGLVTIVGAAIGSRILRW
ncbi:NrsF family protein [Methylopila sp. M107]|uniref:NrsF family protein n=1 Tax=Methylopila sp. M107 TaxID=1101190 RepID=UPI00035E8426|nr:NrsF family protein [Methylopila sp. M107]